jgi:hypothetical protein
MPVLSQGEIVVHTMIDVPRQIVALGFSGRFHTLCRFPSEQAQKELTDAAPCLLNGPGWLLLRVTEDGLGVLVRRDDCAVIENVTCDAMVDRYRTAGP